MLQKKLHKQTQTFHRLFLAWDIAGRNDQTLFIGFFFSQKESDHFQTCHMIQTKRITQLVLELEGSGACTDEVESC
jgi:hypothetical protein